MGSCKQWEVVRADAAGDAYIKAMHQAVIKLSRDKLPLITEYMICDVRRNGRDMRL